ncbi:MAG: radical SAM protein [Candidatus Omnitrophica bacterium]|nr:radical SAM protein [Candidatus Omnitrophota bacterium]
MAGSDNEIMQRNNYKYIYGPVPSWRLGRSLGIDPISGKVKACSFDCIYCQVGKGRVRVLKRRVYVPAEKVIQEIRSLPPRKIDYITFSGIGEPTLAKNLGELVKGAKKLLKKKVAVLTNSSLIDRVGVQKDLRSADFVIAKLDASSEEIFKRVNRPRQGLRLAKIIKGIKTFKSGYRGTLALQVMFVKENKDTAWELAKIAKEIAPDEVQINTPLRPCGVKPLSRKEIDAIKKDFKGMKVVSVYDAKRKKVKSISKKDVLSRRGKV